MRRREQELRQRQVQEYLDSNNELLFELDMEPVEGIERPIPPTVQPMRPQKKEPVRNGEALQIKIGQEPVSSFLSNLVIPDDFWDSPDPSPLKKGKFYYPLEKKEYPNFKNFAEIVLYPALEEILWMQEQSQGCDQESHLIELNYKMLSDCRLLQKT